MKSHTQNRHFFYGIAVWIMFCLGCQADEGKTGAIRLKIDWAQNGALAAASAQTYSRTSNRITLPGGFPPDISTGPEQSYVFIVSIRGKTYFEERKLYPPDSKLVFLGVPINEDIRIEAFLFPLHTISNAELPAYGAYPQDQDERYKVMPSGNEITLSMQSRGPLSSGGDSIFFIEAGEGVWDEVHIFKQDGTLTFTNAPHVPAQILLVGGGGGGGIAFGGGGGGGAVLSLNDISLSATSFEVKVGTGGAAAVETSPAPSEVGKLSSFKVSASETWKALGGGGGGTANTFPANNGANAPASSNNKEWRGGGGGGGIDGTGGSSVDDSALGSWSGGAGSANAGGGGGGASGKGRLGVNSDTLKGHGGGGGAGTASSITGVSVLYGGGGGGAGSLSGGAGGVGGGGDGGDALFESTGKDGQDGSGGGGGGGALDATNPSPAAVGGKGGNGIVIVRFPYQVP